MNKPFLLCIGHRGAMGYEPENTLRSIRKAIDMGAKCIEIDVYWVDGHLMVFHDDRLERTTNGTGALCERSFDYLRSLDAGQGERIPTLGEVCETIGPDIGLNIELKGPGTADPAAAFIARVAEAGWNKKNVLVSSFRPDELKRMKECDPEIRLGVLIDTQLQGGLKLAGSLAAFSIHPIARAVNRRFVEQAHADGLKVYVHTVNSARSLARMVACGVDGVFTNFPDRVLENHAQGEGETQWIGRADVQ